MAQNAPQMWQSQPHAAAQMVQLQGVTILPATQVQRHIANGGPVWPPNSDIMLRHCRDGMAVGTPPEPPADAPTLHLPRAVWGGFLDAHFGHFMAEHLSRIANAAAQMPTETFVFTVDPALGQGDLPKWMWDILAHIGVARGQVHLAQVPVLVDRLFAGPQAEMLPQVAPSSGYLDLLDRLGAHVQPLAHDLVYVSRALLPAAGGGGTAGEIYLETLLRFAGVQVLDPASASIADQMNTYAGARHLVFAEGSALHGRQLLGHLPQRITVLRRRKGRNMARAMLAPRVSALSYADVTASSLVPQWKNGAPRPDPALALYDLPALFAAFAKIGIDLASGWDNAAFRAAAMVDIAGWLDHHRPNPRLAQAHAQTLIAAGYDLPSCLPRHTRDLSKG